MDIPSAQPQQPKQQAQPPPTSNLSVAGTKALDDLFSFDAPTMTAPKAADPFLDFNAPLISSSG